MRTLQRTLDELIEISDDAERRSRSNDLVNEIADGLATAGEYLTRIDVLPTKHVVDFNWAAHQAARRLGIRVHVDVRHAKATVDGRAEVRVAAQSAPE